MLPSSGRWCPWSLSWAKGDARLFWREYFQATRFKPSVHVLREGEVYSCHRSSRVKRQWKRRCMTGVSSDWWYMLSVCRLKTRHSTYTTRRRSIWRPTGNSGRNRPRTPRRPDYHAYRGSAAVDDGWERDVKLGRQAARPGGVTWPAGDAWPGRPDLATMLRGRNQSAQNERPPPLLTPANIDAVNSLSNSQALVLESRRTPLASRAIISSSCMHNSITASSTCAHATAFIVLNHLYVVLHTTGFARFLR